MAVALLLGVDLAAWCIRSRHFQASAKNRRSMQHDVTEFEDIESDRHASGNTHWEPSHCSVIFRCDTTCAVVVAHLAKPIKGLLPVVFKLVDCNQLDKRYLCRRSLTGYINSHYYISRCTRPFLGCPVSGKIVLSGSLSLGVLGLSIAELIVSHKVRLFGRQKFQMRSIYFEDLHSVQLTPRQRLFSQ